MVFTFKHIYTYIWTSLKRPRKSHRIARKLSPIAGMAPASLKIIRSNSEFDEIGKDKEFLHIAVLECTKFLCDWIDVYEDMNKCILIEFAIWFKSV